MLNQFLKKSDLLYYLVNNFLNVRDINLLSQTNKDLYEFFKSTDLITKVSKQYNQKSSGIIFNHENDPLKLHVEKRLKAWKIRDEHGVYANKEDAKAQLLVPMLANLQHNFYQNKDLQSGFKLMAIYLNGISCIVIWQEHYTRIQTIGKNPAKAVDTLQELEKILKNLELECHKEYKASLKDNLKEFQKNEPELTFDELLVSMLSDIYARKNEAEEALSKNVAYLFNTSLKLTP